MVAKFLALVALVMGVVLYFSFSWGFVLYKFWYWFLMDVFPDLPEITIMQAVGLKLFAGILVTLRNPELKEELYNEDKISRTVSLAVLPWISLIFGYFIYLFIS